MECKAFLRKSKIKDHLLLEVLDSWVGLMRNGLQGFKVGDPVRVTIDRWSEHGTNPQNRLFHALLNVYLTSGLASDDCIEAMKIRVKETYGIPHKVVSVEITPNHFVKYKYLKSWSEYKIPERSKTIDGLIDEMLMLGINIDKYVLEWNEWRAQ